MVGELIFVVGKWLNKGLMSVSSRNETAAGVGRSPANPTRRLVEEIRTDLRSYYALMRLRHFMGPRSLRQ